MTTKQKNKIIEPQTEKQKFDVLKRRESAFSASVENVKQANTAIGLAQNWLLILSTVELTFLGSLLFSGDILSKCQEEFVKFLITVILVAFISFLFGAVFQFKHMASRARMFESVTIAADVYLNKGELTFEKAPQDLSFQKPSQIKSSNITNYLFSFSFISIVGTTLGIIVLIFIF